jgi:hypothetical protein
MRRRSRSGAGLAAMAVLCVAAATPGQAWAVPAEGPGDLPVYRTADDAEKVRGARSSADAQVIGPGISTDAIGPGEELYYRVDLDDKSSAFISTVAAPRPGGAVKYSDGIEVSLRSTDGTDCTSNEVSFGSSEQTRPIADYTFREIEKNAACQQAGTYYYVVKRTSDQASDPAPWPMEIRFMQEPGVKSLASTAPPAAWNSKSPSPPTDPARKREGGTGFNDARSLTGGVWKDALKPGETRFYQVPLDWGQQLSVAAELANATTRTKSSGYAVDGLTVDLYNTARGRVDSDRTGYDGKPRSVTMGPTAPVAYGNRFGTADDVSGMCFAGWYYLAVTLGEEVGEFTSGAVPLTLRLTIGGKREPGPEYTGDAAAAGFGITDADRDAADKGLTSPENERSGTLKLVAAGGLGTGTALLFGLAAWTFLARRKSELRGRG